MFSCTWASDVILLQQPTVICLHANYSFTIDRTCVSNVFSSARRQRAQIKRNAIDTKKTVLCIGSSAGVWWWLEESDQGVISQVIYACEGIPIKVLPSTSCDRINHRYACSNGRQRTPSSRFSSKKIESVPLDSCVDTHLNESEGNVRSFLIHVHMANRAHD